ncbi:hypothetical protein ACQ4PT_001161 [Festuca glaucescens]
MGQDEDNWAASLPDDLLVDILGRLAPRWLAVSRSVCKAWQATIDARRLLRTDRLPLRLGGIFMYFSFHKFPEFFSRPGTPITGKMDFLPSANKKRSEVQDHCNGLLLLQDEDAGIPKYVVNPATRHWDSLGNSPPIRVMGVEFSSDGYLAFDPMVSPHYEVFMIPYIPWMREGEHLDPSIEESEWPPATFILNVFSSRTHCWEPRSFHREGDALGTIAEMRAQGATSNEYTETHLGRSAKGVYFAWIYECKLQVLILDESCGKMKWMLKQDHNLVLPYHKSDQHGPWVLKDMNFNYFRHRIPTYMYRKEEAISDEDEFEWSSDDDRDIIANRDMAKEQCYDGDITILGFHPFKEIIFLLLVGLKTPLAYNYNSFKAEVLGKVKPTGYEYFMLPNDARTIEGFPYVPCWLEEIPSNTQSTKFAKKKTQSRSSS